MAKNCNQMEWTILGGGNLTHFLRKYAKQKTINCSVMTRTNCDFSDLKSTENIMKNISRESVIIVTAAINRARDNSIKSFEENVRIVSNIISATKKHKKHFVFFSSIDVFGLNPSLPINERTPLSPFDYYSRSKMLSEFMIEKSLTDRGTPWTIFRLPGLYGNKDAPMGVIGNLCLDATKQSRIHINQTKDIERDFFYASDVPAFVKEACDKSVTGAFNLVTGKSTKLEDIVRKIKSLVPNLEVVYQNEIGEKRPGVLRFDNKQLKQFFLKAPLTSLNKGLRNHF